MRSEHSREEMMGSALIYVAAAASVLFSAAAVYCEEWFSAAWAAFAASLCMLTLMVWHLME